MRRNNTAAPHPPYHIRRITSAVSHPPYHIRRITSAVSHPPYHIRPITSALLPSPDYTPRTTFSPPLGRRLPSTPIPPSRVARFVPEEHIQRPVRCEFE